MARLVSLYAFVSYVAGSVRKVPAGYSASGKGCFPGFLEMTLRVRTPRATHGFRATAVTRIPATGPER